MKTYPLRREEGSFRGFEIASTWLTLGLVRLLRATPAVADVRRQWFNDDRVVFEFHGKRAVVNEP
jgi:hypothetical protein